MYIVISSKFNELKRIFANNINLENTIHCNITNFIYYNTDQYKRYNVYDKELSKDLAKFFQDFDIKDYKKVAFTYLYTFCFILRI